MLESSDSIDGALKLLLSERSRERHTGYVRLSNLLGTSKKGEYDDIFEDVFKKISNQFISRALSDFDSIDGGLRIVSGNFLVLCLMLCLSQGKYFEGLFADKVVCVQTSIHNTFISNTLYILQGGCAYRDINKKWEEDGPRMTLTEYIRKTISRPLGKTRELRVDRHSSGFVIITGDQKARC